MVVVCGVVVVVVVGAEVEVEVLAAPALEPDPEPSGGEDTGCTGTVVVRSGGVARGDVVGAVETVTMGGSLITGREGDTTVARTVGTSARREGDSTVASVWTPTWTAEGRTTGDARSQPWVAATTARDPRTATIPGMGHHRDPQVAGRPIVPGPPNGIPCHQG